MQKTLIFILSANYSGSHYLSLMLGSHSQAEHLGELKNLVKDDVDCQMCEQPDECSLFQGIGDVPRPLIYENLFSRVDDRVTHLVDASKKISWFQQFVADDRYDIRLIHLIRDPRALARRWLLEFDQKHNGPRERWRQIRKNPLAIHQLLVADRLELTCYKWCTQNREIADFIAGSGRDFKRVTYRDIALAPAGVLTDISRWLKIPPEPGQEQYWNFRHHGTEKPQYREGSASGIDLRWKSFLSADQISRVENHAQVNRLLQRMGLEFCEDGLQLSGSSR